MAPDFERLARMPWPMACFASSGIKLLSSALALLVLQVRVPRADEDVGELRPRIGGAHIDDADRLNARPWRSDPEQGRGLTALHTAPEFPLSGNDQVLIKRIGMGRDLNPFPAAGDHRQDRRSRRHDPHIVLQLGHIFRHRRFLRERPGQHELGLEDGLATLDTAIEGCPHPAQRRVPNSPLDISYHLARVGLVPVPIKVLGHDPELDDKVAGQILWLDLSALFAPEPKERLFIIAHDDPGVRAADEATPICRIAGCSDTHFSTLQLALPGPIPHQVRQCGVLKSVHCPFTAKICAVNQNRYDVMILIPVQCRMARAALDLGIRELARSAKVSIDTITRFERGDPLKERTVEAI